MLVKPDHEEKEYHGTFCDVREAIKYCFDHMDELRSRNDYWVTLGVTSTIDSNGNYKW